MTLRHFALTALLLLPAGTALADGVVQKLMTQSDKARLEAFDATRKSALDEARAGGTPADIAVLDELVAREPQPFQGLDLTGDWQCRTIKAGGLAELIVYGWFRCRVTDDGSGWMLTKLTGSQRTTGRFYDDGDTRLIYLGSFSVNDETARPYGSGPESDQVGYAYRIGEQSWRIELPAPYYDSKLDIMEFRR
jgi:hypothetical protein